MNTHANIAKKIMQAAIFAGLLFAVPGGIVTLVFIKIPIIVRILFCIGCFVSAGLNFRTYKRVKKRNKMNGQKSV